MEGVKENRKGDEEEVGEQGEEGGEEERRRGVIKCDNQRAEKLEEVIGAI